MPVTIKKIGKRFSVSTPSGIKSKSTSKKNALAQQKIINAADAGRPFTGKKKKGKK